MGFMGVINGFLKRNLGPRAEGFGGGTWVDTQHATENSKDVRSRWDVDGIDLKDPEGPYASQRLRQPKFTLATEPKFRINKDDRFFAIGSCFARGIESILKARRFEVASAADDFDGFEARTDVKITNLGFTNKYTTHSILNEIRWALDPQVDFPIQSLVDIDETHCIDPHINPTLKVIDRAGTIGRRKIMSEVTRRIRTCSVVFITLGLVEAWYDTQAEVFLNITPTAEMRRLHPKRYRLLISDYMQNMENMQSVYALLSRYGKSGLRIVVTTSPVPLRATYSGRDIVVANTYSKSVLRVVAQDFASMHKNVEYFPSYELVMNSSKSDAWEDDLRHVRSPMTQHVMKIFLRDFVKN